MKKLLLILILAMVGGCSRTTNVTGPEITITHEHHPVDTLMVVDTLHHHHDHPVDTLMVVDTLHHHHRHGHCHKDHDHGKSDKSHKSEHTTCEVVVSED